MSTRTCIQCGWLWGDTAKFCGRCGRALTRTLVSLSPACIVSSRHAPAETAPAVDSVGEGERLSVPDPARGNEGAANASPSDSAPAAASTGRSLPVLAIVVAVTVVGLLVGAGSAELQDRRSERENPSGRIGSVGLAKISRGAPAGTKGRLASP
ncbi:MAG TPA: hypothetical protein VEK07_20190 [Polyangiaceae bacterium]|nr:hypothetical protein [Polyangiaceae bacterium]